MENESKKLALIRIYQILKKHSDCDHPLTQQNIADKLQEYGIDIERKAISHNLSLLKEAGIQIESTRAGSYLDEREFEDSELRMLIDGVLSSRYITAKQSSAIIERLCALSNKFFKARIRHIQSVNDWVKSENKTIFYNIDVIDDAIEQGLQIEYDYNKYGADKKLHKSSQHKASPYQLVLHNQRYYLVSYNEKIETITYHRLDRITNIKLLSEKATPLNKLSGYEKGLDFKMISSSLPYMFNDKPQKIELLADNVGVDQIIDWFGTDVKFENRDRPDKRINVTLSSSANAMEYWALQYVKHVEIVSPPELRDKIKQTLTNGIKRYDEAE